MTPLLFVVTSERESGNASRVVHNLARRLPCLTCLSIGGNTPEQMSELHMVTIVQCLCVSGCCIHRWIGLECSHGHKEGKVPVKTGHKPLELGSDARTQVHHLVFAHATTG